MPHAPEPTGRARETPRPMYRQIPNQLTILRLFLAAAFFLVLNFYRYKAGPDAVLLAAGLLFVAAAFTDWLDGYLARRWHAESSFGRIMDPFCDKVLVLGAFIYLSGPRFVDPGHVEGPGFYNIIRGNMSSGVYPWMVAAILARELLVTGIRGELEGRGVKFGANLFGKLKMVLQSVAIPVVLFIVWLDPQPHDRLWLAVTRNVLVFATVLVTVVSGWPYVIGAARAMRGERAIGR